jgi:hypothetical protein
MKSVFPGVVWSEEGNGEEMVRSFGDGARSSSPSFTAMGPRCGTPSRHGTIARCSPGPSPSNDLRLAAWRAKLRELGVFMLPRCVFYDAVAASRCCSSLFHY